jgi:hypothetical protein
MDHQEDARLAESFRNAAITSLKVWNRFRPFKRLIVTQPAFKKHAVMK